MSMAELASAVVDTAALRRPPYRFGMPNAASPDADHYPMPSDDDIARVSALLRKIGGPNVSWGSINVFDVLVGEHRLKLERLASDRLTRATWVLAGATIVLALATVVLIFATIAK